MAVDFNKTEPCALRAKVAFLKQARSYAEQPAQVSAIETHMSWVFLTDAHAYKLKKPVRYEFLDFSTLEARRRDCEEEIRLNRRLAPAVYLANVALTLTPSGQLALDEPGEVVDWLVKMRRLPEQRMLDALIRKQRVTAPEIERLVQILVGFYRLQQSVELSPDVYRQQLSRDTSENALQLTLPQYQLDGAQIDTILRAQQQLLREQAQLFERRARAGKIVEGHGDLRPEHVCLEPTPVIIDCLEFKREFRILDPADELAFLAMECERLGAAQVAQHIFDAYRRTGFDDPPQTLVHFYKSYRACLRAKLAVWHLREPVVVNSAKWITAGQQYLDIAERHARCFG